jgi:hypothetical protein
MHNGIPPNRIPYLVGPNGFDLAAPGVANSLQSRQARPVSLETDGGCGDMELQTVLQKVQSCSGRECLQVVSNFVPYSPK